MNTALRLIVLTALAGCNVSIDAMDNLTPQQCRSYGVGVPDNAPITGQIIGSTFGTFGKLEKECFGTYGWLTSGCAVPVEGQMWPSPSHQYHIWYADHKCTPQHEACHALYEVRHHTVHFNLEVMQGNPIPACLSTRTDADGSSARSV